MDFTFPNDEYRRMLQEWPDFVRKIRTRSEWRTFPEVLQKYLQNEWNGVFVVLCRMERNMKRTEEMRKYFYNFFKRMYQKEGMTRPKDTPRTIHTVHYHTCDFCGVEHSRDEKLRFENELAELDGVPDDDSIQVRVHYRDEGYAPIERGHLQAIT
ncbi:unnamed protein product [Caenorhabditis nigoni]|uniref:Uncharacterized protein n=1 Tax=Caenorhabditis nigoni TaxID=1611254 RepID=A0A2G5SD48_9PELO|nr:hypothetical protein B9Z55_028101 [Caenorhabditis nigoni]